MPLGFLSQRGASSGVKGWLRVVIVPVVKPDLCLAWIALDDLTPEPSINEPDAIDVFPASMALKLQYSRQVINQCLDPEALPISGEIGLSHHIITRSVTIPS